MGKKKAPKADNSLEKSKQEKTDEFINVFNYFENANIRNRDAFCELLDYSVENRREPHK
ncbi:MAG TPA: hypothetical protein VEG39_05035 [Clostridia bacterium]|nr:hypothetical protein [Clostridia bacterium]